jgi:Arc/MetJ-type ribon-helix-helix transcriptional regulator
MRNTQQFSITLPNEMAEVVTSKVATGEYASEREVILAGLRALMARDRVVENWLHEQVGPAYDALKADPTRAVPIDDVRALLAAEHEASGGADPAFGIWRDHETTADIDEYLRKLRASRYRRDDTRNND